MARADHVVQARWRLRRLVYEARVSRLHKIGGTSAVEIVSILFPSDWATLPRTVAQDRPLRVQADLAPSTNSTVAITRDKDNNGRHERALPPMPFSEAFSGAFRECSQAPPRSGPGDADRR